ncbi:MAG: hypothetical protein U0R71_16675 [Solirubrobacterales bacterium]
MRRLAAATAALALIAALAVGSAALAEPAGSGLDPSYGEGGKVAVTQPPGAFIHYSSVREFASARDGAVYVLGDGLIGACPSCRQVTSVIRIDSSGGFDPGFGGRAGVVLSSVAAAGGESTRYQISADSQGRPLVSSSEGGAVTVRRFDLSGRPDASFGAAGVATVPCECAISAVRVVPAQGGRVLVEASRPLRGGEYTSRPGVRVTLTRLLPNGAPDPAFGRRGSASFSFPGLTRPTATAVSKRGAVLLGGSSPRLASLVYVVRVSARGRLDTRFDRAASASMRRLRALGEFPSLSSVLARGDGTTELVGTSELTGGFDLRLRPNGRLARGFAGRGLSVLPLPPQSATLGSGGAIFAATEAPQVTVFRILKNGRPDARFGGDAGIVAPVSGEGIVVGTQDGRRAVVMDVGYVFCRFGGCENTPAIARYTEPPTRRHRR